MPGIQDNVGVFPSFPLVAAGAQSLNRFSQSFPDPYLDYASTQMPRSIYDVLRWCFLPGSLVRMKDGSLRPIEDIRAGDVVINRKGDPGRVARTSSRPWSGPIVKIYTADGAAVPLCSIPEHSHFSVRTPRLKPSCCVDALKASCVTKRLASELRVGDYLISPLTQLDETGQFPRFDPYIAGYYLHHYASVGSCGDRKQHDTGKHYAVRLIVNDDHSAVRRRLESTLSNVAAVDRSYASTVCAVHDPELTDALLDLCGNGDCEKCLPEVVFTWSKDSALHFLAGYLDAAGHALMLDPFKFSGAAIPSCNLSLLLQVRRLANAVGLTPTLSPLEKQAGCILRFNWHDLKTLQPYSEKLCSLTLKEDGKEQPMWTVLKEDTVYRRINRIEEEDYAGLVYNLEIEGEHSYLVNECATSNCEFVWITYGTYRMASQRVVRYFLTKIELTDASDDEKEKYEKFIDSQLHMMNSLAYAGDNVMAYGNCFVSLYIPFRRYLRCPKCHIEQPIGKIDWHFDNWEFRARCRSEKCKYEGAFTRVDRRALEQDKIKYVFWPPHEIRLIYHPVSQEIQYLWQIPEYFKASIRDGNPFYLEKTPWEIVEAVKNDQIFRFGDDIIFHMRDTVISGVRTFGWGVPLIMSNFKQAWYIQVLKRYNEAIALDYIIPFRVLTPKPGSSREADPLLNMNLGHFQQRTLAMFKQHRRDPTTIHALPFPVELQLLGAEGKNLAPTELLESGVDEFLNAQGIPAEMYKGTLQWQAMPTALRLFERTWVSLVSNMNDLINWTFKRVSSIKNWEDLKGRLQPVTMADDIEKKQIQLQLAAGQQISKQTALAPFGINFRDEIKRVLEEEQYSQEQMARFQEEMAQKQELQSAFAQGAQNMAQPGAPMAGGAPMQPGAPMGGAPMGAPSAGGSITPEDMTMQAEQIAQQMLAMPFELRKSELLKIKKSNETMHALVISKMNAIRQMAKSQGGYQALQSMVGAGSAM